MASTEKVVVVLGAGVIGLTAALAIQEKGGFQVTIVADTLPTDAKSVSYTSHWAGAHHVMNLGSDFHHKLEKETLDVMWKMSEPGSGAEHCFLRAPQREFYTVPQADPDLLSVYQDFRQMSEEEYSTVPGATSGVALTALNINTPAYIPYLLSRFLAAGGTLQRASINHIDQILEGGLALLTGSRVRGTHVDALICCPGLAARTLGGLEDKEVFPQRGQTVIIHAPWIRESGGRSLVGETGSHTYIIPRRSGDIILGGTRVPDDWYPKPRPETKIDILQRTLALYPEIAPPEIRAKRTPTIEDIEPLIVEEGCGFRPARKGGIRMETEWRDVPGSQGRKVPVIFNYGHAGYGFQTSWGSANVVMKLLEEAMTQVQ
ncbi:D-amino-acid oxidase [Peniophora sp. CONT]|nr:D-amino-acid oxidase [Peniophora sp. CONT]